MESTTSSATFFTVGDAETPAENLVVSAVSADTTLVPNGNILNNSVFVADIDEMSDEPTRAFNKPSLLPDPANTILVFTISDRKPPYPGEDHTHSDHWSSWAAVLRDISPDRHLRSSSKDSTKGSSNYLYADSSVQTHTAIEIKKHITSGKNIGLIPGIRN